MPTTVSSSNKQQTCALVLLPPSRRSDRTAIANDLRTTEWLPLDSIPEGEEGEVVIVSAEAADSLRAHGLAVGHELTRQPGTLTASESLAEHVQTTITNDPCLRSFKTLFRIWKLNFRDYTLFRPANFTRHRFDEFRAALLALDSETSRVPEKTFDHLWVSSLNDCLPFTLRMALEPAIDLGDCKADPAETLSWSHDRRLVITRQAALRRDALFVALIDALTSGSVSSEGFLATDAERHVRPIAPAWWRDPAMVCDLRAGTLGPADTAPTVAPHFREIVLRSTTEPQSLYSTGLGGRPTSKHLFLPELRKRASKGALADDLAKEAKALWEWLTENHPTAPPATIKTISEAIRAEYRSLKSPLGCPPETHPKTF